MKSHNVPKNMYLSITHLHQGNSSRNKRKGHPYVTIAKLFERNSNELVAVGKAYCSRKDNPSRMLGREIAVGRACKKAGIV